MEKENSYLEELNTMLEKAVLRMKVEKCDFIIYTVSIWTDRFAKVSAISFDSKSNSLKNVDKSNEYNRKYYEEYISEGDFESAELFKADESGRFCNPADFQLESFEEFDHDFVPSRWHPTLVKFGKLAFEKIISELNVDHENFELGINSNKDWYDRRWNIQNLKTSREI